MRRPTRDEIGIARKFQSPPEIVSRPAVGQVSEGVIADSDMAFIRLGGIGFDVDDLLRVQAASKAASPTTSLKIEPGM